MSGQRTLGKPGPYSANITGLRAASPLQEGLQRAGAQDVQDAFRAFYPRDPSGALQKFEEAGDKLKSSYGGRLDIVRAHGGAMKVALRLEFPTSDRTLDTDLDSFVSGRGFRLQLMIRPPADSREFPCEQIALERSGGFRDIVTVPRTERAYVISESGASAEIDRVLRTCESIIALAETLSPPRELPENVVEISKARVSRPPPPSEPLKKPGSGTAG